MKLFVSALEPSSNVHLRGFINALLESNFQHEIRISGIYDENIFLEQKDSATLRFEKPLFSVSDFSVMGFVSVLGKLKFFKNALRKSLQNAFRSDVVLLMDGSSFHLRLAKDLKKANFNGAIFYYILPQIWAWKAWRVAEIMQNFDALFATLPFELENYKNYVISENQNPKNYVFENVENFCEFLRLENARSANLLQKLDNAKKSQNLAQVVYVGHPLFDSLKLQDSFQQVFSKNEIQEASCVRSDISASKKTLVFMPGSRLGEISRIFPVLSDLARCEELKNYRKVLVAPLIFKSKNLDEIYTNTSSFEISFDAKKSLLNAHFSFICSGTATLESALLGVPFLLCYRAKFLDFIIAKSFLKIKFIGLANIMWSKFNDGNLHPELIQNNCNKKSLLEAFLNFDFENFHKNVGFLRNYLKHGSALNVLKLVLQMYNQNQIQGHS